MGNGSILKFVSTLALAAVVSTSGLNAQSNPGQAPTYKSLNLLNGQILSVSPTGNPTGGSLLTTYSSLNVTGTTTKDGNREYLAHFGLTSTKGSGATNNNQDKVAIYGGIVGENGTGDIWAFNTVTTMKASSGTYDAQGYELDFNNNNAHRGDADGGTGLASPIAYGLTVTGAGAYRSTPPSRSPDLVRKSGTAES